MIEREGGPDIEKSMRQTLNVGFISIYTIVGVMQRMSQNNYIILHAGLISRLDRIEVAL